MTIMDTKVLFKNIPHELTKYDNWLLWKYCNSGDNKKPRKIPHQIESGGVNSEMHYASTNNPAHAWPYIDVATKFQHEDHLFDGIGYTLVGCDNDITIIDLDNCLDGDGSVHPWAHEIVELASTYTEISPSGNGLRLILNGTLDKGAFVNSERGIEVYQSGEKRYLTITGNLLPGFCNVEELHDADGTLVELLEQYRPERRSKDYVAERVTDISKEKLVQILDDLDPEIYTPYNKWLQLGMGIHHQFGAEGLEIWDKLSQKTPLYNRAELEYKWGTFGKYGGGEEVTIRSFLPEGVKGSSFTVSPDEFPMLDDEDESVGEKPTQREKPKGKMTVVTDYHDIPNEMVEDLLAVAEVSCWTGPPGSMKTMTLMDLALHMTSQIGFGDYAEWLGKFVRQGPVLWLAYEGISAVKKRLRGHIQRYNRGDFEGLDFDGVPDDFHLVQPGIPMTDDDWPEAMMELIRELRPAMVVIDTLATSMQGVDENSSDDMTQVARRLRMMANNQKLHCAYVHHSSKGGADMRGSGALEGDIDTLIRFTKGSQRFNRVTLEVKKQRNLGTVGFKHQLQCETIATGKPTSFGKPEIAPYVTPLIVGSGQLAPEHQELRTKLVDAITKEGGQLDRKDYIPIMNLWLDDNYPDSGVRGKDKHRSDALKALEKDGGLIVHRSQKGNQVVGVSLQEIEGTPSTEGSDW